MLGGRFRQRAKELDGIWQRKKSKNQKGNWDDAQLDCQFRLWLVQPRFFFHQAAEVMNVAVANEQGSARNFI
jgi:hypothetical protein